MLQHGLENTVPIPAGGQLRGLHEQVAFIAGVADGLHDHSARSLVVTMPPSPPVVMILSWQNDQQPTWPKPPTGRPRQVAPWAWAQSSIR